MGTRPMPLALVPEDKDYCQKLALGPLLSQSHWAAAPSALCCPPATLSLWAVKDKGNRLPDTHASIHKRRLPRPGVTPSRRPVFTL